MICKSCSNELTSLDYHCPNCGVRTGVQAKRSFKWSLGCSGIGLGVALLCIIGIYVSMTTNINQSSVNTNALGLAYLMLLALGSALIGVVFAIVGFATKNYKLARKNKQ
jgi:hypothetical protein